MDHPSTLTFSTSLGNLRLDVLSRSDKFGVRQVLDRFYSLVLADFYSNVTVHRVLKNFYLAIGQSRTSEESFQKGCSESNLFDIPPDTSLTLHVKGMVALAKGGDLIISLDACNNLEGKYMIIGQVEPESLSILSSLEELETDERDKPLVNLGLTLTSIDHLSEEHKTDLITKKDHIRQSGMNNVQPPSTPVKPSQPPSTTGTPPAPIECTESPASTPMRVDQPITNRKRRLTESGRTISILRKPAVNEEEGRRRSKLARNASIILNNQQVISQPFCANTMTRSSSMPSLDSKFYSSVRPKWPRRLVIIRHGQSEQNAALDLMDPNIDTLSSIRDADIQLTPLGRWQATETGKYLASGEKFDICFSSPYQRAMDTADLITKELPYDLKRYTDNWLREKEFGGLHGMDDKSVKEKFPQEVAIRKRDGRYWYKFPGGENYPAVEIRVHLFLEKICRDYAGRSVLVVTHQVPYKLFRSRIQYLDEAGVLGLEVTPNCGIQEYVIDRMKNPEGRMKLKNWNLIAYDPSNRVPEDNSIPKLHLPTS